MLDSRIFAAILLMGLAAVVSKGLELWNWYVNEETLEVQPVVIDTQTNGGVSSTTGAKAKIWW